MKKFPSDWKTLTLSDFIEKLDAGVSVNAEDVPVNGNEIGVLKVSCVSNGRFLPHENKRILLNEVARARLPVRKDTIIISRSNTNVLVGESAFVTQDYPNLFHSDKLWQTVFRNDVRFCPRWLSQVLISQDVRKRVGNLATGTSGSMKNISKETLLALEILTPTFDEQKSIAEIFASWDAAIEKTEKLIAAKVTRKRGLMQQLLTGKQRFKNFDDQQWKTMKISDFTVPKPRITSKPDKPFTALGIRSHGKGTFLKENFDPHKIEMTELYEVRENDLILNITFAWEGAIAIAGAKDTGALVSHRFPTYEFDTDQAIPEYFRHVIVQKWLVEKLGFISPGGAGRNRVLNKKDFGKLEVLMPSIEEQRRIAAVLETCDQEIELLRKQLAALKQQKSGLMQKLLTGQIRVKVMQEAAR